MDLFDSKRQERLAAAAIKEAARAFLIRAGIMTPNGELAKQNSFKVHPSHD